MHVLGMPPAFVLSQDQTLHKIYFRVLSSFTYLLALFPFPKKLFELSESALSVSLIVFSLSSGLFAFQLFNFQRAFRRLATAFIYYHIIYSLSTPFLKYFSFFLFGANRSLTTCISYHFSYHSVNAFFTFLFLMKFIVLIFR